METATKLDSLVLVDVHLVKKMRVEHYTNVIPNWVKVMRTFGKAGTVSTRRDGKVGDPGVTWLDHISSKNFFKELSRPWNLVGMF